MKQNLKLTKQEIELILLCFDELKAHYHFSQFIKDMRTIEQKLTKD